MPEPDPLIRKAGGELLAIWAEIRECERCGPAGTDRIYGTGHPRAPIMLVKDKPSPEDLESTNAFTSEADALTKAFDALGIPVSWIYGTCAVRSEGGDVCPRHLVAEIEAVTPRVIVAFGPASAEALAALDGSCGLRVPDAPESGRPVPIRSDVSLIVTEPLPEGITQKDAKKRLWRDLQAIPPLVAR